MGSRKFELVMSNESPAPTPRFRRWHSTRASAEQTARDVLNRMVEKYEGDRRYSGKITMICYGEDLAEGEAILAFGPIG